MAIEIRPKSKTQKFSLGDIPLILVVILFLALLGSYFALNIYHKKMEDELSTLKKSLEKTPEQKVLEEEIFGSERIVGYQQKIKDFSVLLSAHKLPLNLFNFLEENTHPKIWFSKFNLDSEKNLLNISGFADNFEVLAQQALIFKDQDVIKNINLSRVSLDKEGKINFDLELTLDSKIFK